MTGGHRLSRTFSPLRSREFRGLSVALLLSVAGDQLCSVSLAVLVYDKTGSPALSGLVFGLAFFPELLGGSFLAHFADSVSRRTVMISCDLVRAVIVGLIAIPGIPLVVQLILLFTIGVLQGPFAAARIATIPESLGPEHIDQGFVLNHMTLELGYALGYTAAGAVVATIGARQGILLDTCTFVLSAAIVRFVSPLRPPAAGSDDDHQETWADRLEGFRAVIRIRELRLIATIFLVAVAAVNLPVGASAPLARQLGHGGGAVGVLLAMISYGNVVGGYLISLVPAGRRNNWLRPFVVGATAPLLIFFADPSYPVAAAVLFVSGMGGTFGMLAQARFVMAAPPRIRGRAIGAVVAALAFTNGATMAIGGALSEVVSSHLAIAVVGAVGTVVLLLIPLPPPSAPSIDGADQAAEHTP